MSIYKLLFLIGLTIGASLAHAEGESASQLLCAKESESVTCRSKELFFRCGEKIEMQCLPVTDEVKLDKENRVNCVCRVPPKGKSYSRLLKTSGEIAKAVAAWIVSGSIPVPADVL